MLRINDFLPSGRVWNDNAEVIRAWVDLHPEYAPGDHNMMMVKDADGCVRTLFYFPDNVVLVKWEEPC